MKKIAIISIVLTSISAFAATNVCTRDKVERTVEVASTDTTKETPCEVKYTKDGNTTVLWNAQNDAQYCKTKADEFVSKLTSMGWTCAEGTASKTETKTTTTTTTKETEAAPAKPAK